MPYVNKIEIMGNLGRNPELRYMPDGRAVTNVSVAVQKTWNDRETREQKERTEWFSVILYGGQAETVCRLMEKGDCLQVWGGSTVSAGSGARWFCKNRVRSNWQRNADYTNQPS